MVSSRAVEPPTVNRFSAIKACLRLLGRWLRALAFWAAAGAFPPASASTNALASFESISNAVFRALPEIRLDKGYVSSRACLECHQEEHASWHRSYHRTMSKPALPGNVKGDFSGTTVDCSGLPYRVYTKDGAFWAEMPDPDQLMYIVQGGRKTPLEQVPRVHRQVVMTTGSHHYETYWVESPRYPKLLQTLPLVYLLAEKRWAPRDEVFMKGPEDKERLVTQWNHHCIRCHSTGGNPGLDARGQLQTQVAEFGIACEACHGPGGPHIAFRRDEAAALAAKKSDPIVNPKKLSPVRSSEVCGQCHGVFTMKDDFAMEYARHGEMFRPGEDVHRTRYYIQYPGTNAPPDRQEDLRRNPSFFRERWWDDGTILAGGREYTAMSASACYQGGQLSCLNCHSMHQSEPTDQLKIFKERNEACTSCHQEAKYNAELARHTFHAPASSGSECVNCHMPHTTYALLGAIRSHQIDSPSIHASARTGTPNACNLCHLDKTLDWTQEHLAKNYGTALAPLSAEQKEISAALLWLLKGHAGQRAIAAWHFGWPPARAASNGLLGEAWGAPFLAELLADDYGVVRHVAGGALRALPGFSEFKFDFLAVPAAREAKRAEARQAWSALLPKPAESPAILLGTGGALRTNEINRLVRGQDRRSVTIKE